MIREKLKNILPVPVRKSYRFLSNLLRGLENYLYDLRKYLKYSGTSNVTSEKQLEARIIAHYHCLEKGLSMPSPRVPFGTDMANSLISLLEKYEKNEFVTTKSQIQAAYKVLDKYFEFHQTNGFELVELSKKSKHLNPSVKQEIEAGSKVVGKVGIVDGASGTFDTLADSRHSIRNYKDSPVEIAKIEEAIRLAQESPSTCNRQSCKVYIIDEEPLIKSTLELQNGNRGFGHLCKLLLVVTSDLQSFCGVNERNQAFIDSGMFAMSLLYALHFKELGACPLNWSVGKRTDQLVRNLLELPESEVVSMMISVGELPDELAIACSHRKDLSEVMHFIKC